MSILSKRDKTFNLCVFCGSSQGAQEKYVLATKDLACMMSQNQWALVYGGGELGLMGILAKSLVNLGGSAFVHGIIPAAFLKKEGGLVITPKETEYGRTTIVNTMHDRKAMMVREADAFIAMPGGFGTMEELFEAMTWSQLGIHDRPVILYNIGGYFNPILDWVSNAVMEGFIPKGQASIFSVAESADDVLRLVKEHTPSSARYRLDWDVQDKAV